MRFFFSASRYRLILFLMAGSSAFAQSPADQTPPAGELSPAPQGRILDKARIFAFDNELQQSLSAELNQAFDQHGLDIYVAAYSFLLGESVEQRARRLEQAWISSPRGLVIVYVRGGGQMTFAASDNMTDFLPRLDLEELFSVAALSAKQHKEPSLRLKAAVEQIVHSLVDRVQSKTASQSLFRPDILALALFVGIALALLALLGFFLAKLESRRAPSFYFPPVHVHARFGAPHGGGSLAEIPFDRFPSNPPQGLDQRPH